MTYNNKLTEIKNKLRYLKELIKKEDDKAIFWVIPIH